MTLRALFAVKKPFQVLEFLIWAQIVFVSDVKLDMKQVIQVQENLIFNDKKCTFSMQLLLCLYYNRSFHL